MLAATAENFISADRRHLVAKIEPKSPAAGSYIGLCGSWAIVHNTNSRTVASATLFRCVDVFLLSHKPKSVSDFSVYPIPFLILNQFGLVVVGLIVVVSLYWHKSWHPQHCKKLAGLPWDGLLHRTKIVEEYIKVHQLVRVADQPGHPRLRSCSLHQLQVPTYRLVIIGTRSFPVA